MSRTPILISRWLAKNVEQLHFDAPTAYVYNPLSYARQPHETYLKKYARQGIDVLFLGMNPGPWGMAQTGIPFGEVNRVRDFLGIHSPVQQPPSMHPQRPIEGFDCKRSEVSGQRLWDWVKHRFKTSETFHERFFISNYCPLVFMEESGRNRTPDKLPRNEQEKLFTICDEALRRLVKWCKPQRIIGIGKFAEKRARMALESHVTIGTILHPSPASPAANRGWQTQIEKQLRAQGVALVKNTSH
jgi:single-strand selective monofunctional uracil DNA glycosylase